MARYGGCLFTGGNVHRNCTCANCIKFATWDRSYKMKNRSKINAYKAQLRKRDKLKAIEAYGYSCVCCGETTPEFLTLDHVNNDGHWDAKKRRGEKIRSGPDFYARLRRQGFPKNLGLQLLCFNCNCGKRMNDGVCPHKTE